MEFSQWKQPPQGVDALKRLCSEGSRGFQPGLTNRVGWSRDQASPWLSPGHQLEVKVEQLKRKTTESYPTMSGRVSLLPEGRTKTSAPINEWPQPRRCLGSVLKINCFKSYDPAEFACIYRSFVSNRLWPSKGIRNRAVLHNTEEVSLPGVWEAPQADTSNRMKTSFVGLPSRISRQLLNHSHPNPCRTMRFFSLL